MIETRASLTTIPSALTEVGEGIRTARIRAELTQEELATNAGIGRRSLTNLENGHDVRISTLLAVMKGLGILDRVGTWLPAPGLTPVERLEQARRLAPRSRVRHSKREQPSQPWAWGDEK